MNVVLFHDVCHLDKMYLLIKCLKSIKGTFKVETSFTIAASLPLKDPLRAGSEYTKSKLLQVSYFCEKNHQQSIKHQIVPIPLGI